MAADVRNDVQASRYALATEAGTAFAAYRRQGDVVDFTHTEVPPAVGGQGIGTRLIAGALEDVRARGWTIRASCPFVAAYVARHPEAGGLLAR